MCRLEHLRRALEDSEAVATGTATSTETATETDAVLEEEEERLSTLALSQSYQWWKQADAEYSQQRAAFLGAPPFSDWIVDAAPCFLLNEDEERKGGEAEKEASTEGRERKKCG